MVEPVNGYKDPTVNIAGYAAILHLVRTKHLKYYDPAQP